MLTRVYPRRTLLLATGHALSEAVKAAFHTRRKTLRNAWKGLYGWSREELEQHATNAGIDLNLRGETLAVEAFDIRAWVIRDSSRPGGLRAVPMPEDVVARFKAG